MNNAQWIIAMRTGLIIFLIPHSSYGNRLSWPVISSIICWRLLAPPTAPEGASLVLLFWTIVSPSGDERGAFSSGDERGAGAAPPGEGRGSWWGGGERGGFASGGEGGASSSSSSSGSGKRRGSSSSMLPICQVEIRLPLALKPLTAMNCSASISSEPRNSSAPP